MECDVYFTPHVKELMEKRSLTDEDETLISAILGSEPLNGTAVFAGCGALRAIRYPAINAKTEHEVSYVYFPNADVQLNGRDIAIVISVNKPGSFSGEWLEPESVVRILEMIAELTRYVFG